MSAAIKLLLKEHLVLGKMLDFTQELANQIHRGVDYKPETLGSVVEFFRVFMKDCLFDKEENLLFAKLERKGFLRQGGVISSMLIDHEKAGKLVRQMANTADDYGTGNHAAGDQWAVAALGFVDLMRDHLKSEEGSLFIMAERFLQPSEHAELAEEFKSLEAARATSGRHKMIHQMPEELLGHAQDHLAGTVG